MQFTDSDTKVEAYLLSFSKLDRCEGGSFSTAIFNSGVQISVHSSSSFISVCPFVALLEATYVCLVDIKKAFMFNLLCVLIWHNYVMTAS